MARRSVITALAVTVPSLMVLAGLVLAVMLATDSGSGLRMGGRIGVLSVEGVITDDAELLQQIRAFRNDPSIKGFVVQINSPGGVVGPSQSIYRELRRLRIEDERPVVASIGSVGASGGYYVALAADSIYALPGSITGSIGVIMEYPVASELLNKVGVQVEVIKSRENKDVGSPFRPSTPGDREVLNELVSDVYRQFVEVVETERRLPASQLAQVTDGRVLSGRQAMQQGLIDRLGNFNDAVAAAGRMAGLGEEPKLIHPPKDDVTLLDVLLGRSLTGAIGRLVKPLEGANSPRVKFVMPW